MTEPHRLLRARRAFLFMIVVLLLVSAGLSACARASPTAGPRSTFSPAPQLRAGLIRRCPPPGPRTSRGPEVGELAVNFALRDADGNEHTLSQLLADKPVVLILGPFT